MAATSNATKTPVWVPVAAAVVFAIVVGLLVTVPDRGQAFVDLEASWTPDHTVTVTWGVGDRSGSKTITAEEEPRFGQREVAERGDVAWIHLSPVGDGSETCAIYVDEKLERDAIARDIEECHVEVIVP